MRSPFKASMRMQTDRLNEAKNEKNKNITIGGITILLPKPNVYPA